MTTLQHQFVRRAISRFKQKTLEHKHDRPHDGGWQEAHDEFAQRLTLLEGGIIQALQGVDPTEIRR